MPPMPASNTLVLICSAIASGVPIAARARRASGPWSRGAGGPRAATVVGRVVAARASMLSFGRALPLLNRTINTTGQMPVRLTVLLVFALVAVAGQLNLDIVLGAFAAGMIVRMLVRGRVRHAFESKLDAIGFGFLIPFFFIHSGMSLDLGAITNNLLDVLKVPLFLIAFVLVRGTPALVLYRHCLSLRDRVALGLFTSTQLPLVVAITSLGVEQGRMRPSTAAALVAAAVLSVLLLPSLAIAARRTGRLERMGLEEETLERPSDRCEMCGAKLTPAELRAVMETGGPALCSIHAAEQEPGLVVDEAGFVEGD